VNRPGEHERAAPAALHAGREQGAEDSAEDRRVQRRRQILDTAKKVFAELGYHDASINEIITRANIARGTFYLYFSNKHKVFDAILDEALEELQARITPIRINEPDVPPPQEQLRENLLRVLDLVLDDQALARLLLDHSQYPHTEVAERVDTFFDDVTALIAASLEHGIAMGLVRPCATSMVAAALLGAVRGVVEHCLEARPAPEIDAVADELLAFVMFGVFRA
jgi:AcrR family transcriptional regulator